MLTEMGGWSRDQCRAALAIGGSLEGAAELLLGGFQLPDFAVPVAGPGAAIRMIEEVGQDAGASLGSADDEEEDEDENEEEGRRHWWRGRRRRSME
eukprot:SAG11_NODE_15218_length_585_cov_0.679012_1_plen_95_part_01